MEDINTKESFSAVIGTRQNTENAEITVKDDPKDLKFKLKINSKPENSNFEDSKFLIASQSDDEKQKESKVLDNDAGEILDLYEFKKKSPSELIVLTESLALKNPNNLNQHDLVFVILKSYAEKGIKIIGGGVLEVLSDGYGFLRSPKSNYIPCSDDIYISPNQIRRFALKTGDTVTGLIRAPKKEERYFSIVNVRTVNFQPVEKNKHRIQFEDLTPLYPEERISLEFLDGTESTLSGRVINIVSPLGKGQRALIVAPPRTGKTVLMQNIAHAIAKNYPDTYLIVLSIGERPEEVTDMLRSVKGEVVSSTFDEPSHRHVQLAEIVIEKAKKLVEAKKDVVILLDSITRLARAYNDIAPSSGKV